MAHVRAAVQQRQAAPGDRARHRPEAHQRHRHGRQGLALRRPDPDGLLYILFHSKGFANTTGYSNEKVDKLLEAGRNTYETADRKKIYDEMQAIIAKDVPMLSLFYSAEYGALRDTVEGFEWIPDQIPRFRDLWKKAK